MRHLYDDNKWTNFCFGCSRHVTKLSLDKVTEFVKLFNAITLMHYMTKESSSRIVSPRCFVFNFRKKKEYQYVNAFILNAINLYQHE